MEKFNLLKMSQEADLEDSGEESKTPLQEEMYPEEARLRKEAQEFRALL